MQIKGTFYICPFCKRNGFTRPFQPHKCGRHMVRICRRLGIDKWESYDLTLEVTDEYI